MGAILHFTISISSHGINYAGYLAPFLPQGRISNNYAISVLMNCKYIFSCTLTNWGQDKMDAIVWILLLKISLKFVAKLRIDNIQALIQIMAWRRPGEKPLSEPMLVSSLTHICITQPQWVKRNSAWQELNTELSIYTWHATMTTYSDGALSKMLIRQFW